MLSLKIIENTQYSELKAQQYEMATALHDRNTMQPIATDIGLLPRKQKPTATTGYIKVPCTVIMNRPVKK